MRKGYFGIVVAGLMLAVLGRSAFAREPSMITTDGPRLLDSAGKPVVLKGCNLGNLLILESWMFGGTLRINGQIFKDQATLYKLMDDRFGPDRRERLMDVFRASYVTARDFDLIKSFGFNTVRLPFDYRALQDDAAPDRLRDGAFRWIDHVLALAEAADVYVILDMHGVPGGQSKQDHTGQSDQNALWRSPAAQDRTVALWKAIAERYKDRSVVAAYDLINEPYADFREDVRPILATLLPRIAEAVRATGDRHLIYFPGALNGGVAFYGDPAAKKLTNVGFTEHYYPGLFGSKPALETHARLLGAELPAKRAYLERAKVPYLVGEFNIVLRSEDPDRLMRLYYDRFAEYGWAATMWSYKLLKPAAGAAPDAWYMATNGDALPEIDVATASYEQIEAFFRGLATGPLAVSESLKAALTATAPPAVPLAKYVPLPTAAPTTPPSDPAGYTSADVATATSGHTAALAGGTVEIVAGGSDINGTSDSFRFVSKDAGGPAALQATIAALADSNQYAKAGVMARWGDSADAAMAMVNVFPDGTLALIARPAKGGPAAETKVNAGVTLPVQLRLDVRNGRATASYRQTRGPWKEAGTVDVATGAFRIGVAVCAHTDDALTTVKAILGPAGDAALPTAAQTGATPAGANLLKNGSFEHAGTAADLAADWNRWGDWINHEDNWKPTHEGRGLIGYHHWQITGPGGSSGLWQDVKVRPGQRYAFSVFAQRDPADAGKQDAATVELRLEGIGPDGPVTLNSRDYAVPTLAGGAEWSRLTVSGTAISDTVRVLAIINAAGGPDRGGAVKLDDATLTPAADGR